MSLLTITRSHFAFEINMEFRMWVESHSVPSHFTVSLSFPLYGDEVVNYKFNNSPWWLFKNEGKGISQILTFFFTNLTINVAAIVWSIEFKKEYDLWWYVSLDSAFVDQLLGIYIWFCFYAFRFIWSQNQL